MVSFTQHLRVGANADANTNGDKPGDNSMNTNNAAETTSAAPSESAAKPTKAKANKTKKQPTKAKGKQVTKAAVPAHEGSLAAFMDALLERTTDVAKLQSALDAETKKRGAKNPGLGGLRSHLRYRQARGKLVGIEIKAE